MDTIYQLIGKECRELQFSCRRLGDEMRGKERRGEERMRGEERRGEQSGGKVDEKKEMQRIDLSI